MPEILRADTEAEPTHHDAARLFSYNERCPICTGPTRYKVVSIGSRDESGLPTGRYVALECVHCPWSEIRC